MIRSNGISTLIACQNEEATVGWCIRSFLDFSDEIIVVDNGSTDASKEICRKMQRQHPEKVQFYDVPHLKDLYENRQYAFERSSYRWIVRADADYICYTSGEYNCVELRSHLLSRPYRRCLLRPEVYYLVQPSVYGDYWHTGDESKCNGDGVLGGVAGKKRLPVVAPAMPRIYHWFPAFRFVRLGRAEGVKMNRVVRRLVRKIYWAKPIWMHCSIKSDLNLLYRAERTNWRELGDYDRYPTLDDYLREQIRINLGTDDLDEAQRRYADAQLLPYLRPYDPTEAYPYPDLVVDAMAKSPVFRIESSENGQLVRRRIDTNVWTLDRIISVN